MKVDDCPDNYVYIGTIVSPHGIKGEVKVKVLTDNPERFSAKEVVYLIKDDNIFESRIIGLKGQGNFVILKLQQIDDRNQAEKWRGFFIGIKKEQLYKLPKDSFYYFEIIGLDVYTVEGNFIGKVADVFATGSNDVYVVKNGQKETLIPAIKEIIEKIDLQGKKIIIHPRPGLLGAK